MLFWPNLNEKIVDSETTISQLISQLAELEKNDVFHENIKTSKFLKGYDGVFKLCGTVTGAPILDQLIDYQASKKSISKLLESKPILGP